MAEGEVTISELELADEVLGDMVLAVDTTTDTKSVSLRQLKAWLGSSLPTGFIIPAVGRISDERFTLLDGKTLARDGTYQAFCNKVVSEVQAGNWFACTAQEYEADLTNHGQCGRFVITNDYVRIPTITKFMGATITLSQIGQAEGAGLPNITGSFKIRPFTNISNVAFGNDKAISMEDATSAGSSSVTVASGSSVAQTPTKINFNASGANSIYGNSDTVTPENIKYPYYMVVSTEGQTSPVEIDINEVYEDLNLKADTDYVDARMPTGTILPYGGSTAPSGFLLCNGGAISRITYAKLFAVIGTTYGEGDGSTTFNLPNISNIVTSVNTNVPIKGNGKTLGLTNGTDVLGPQNWGVDLECRPDCYDKNVGTTTGNVGVTVNACVGITTDASKSGIVGTVTRTVRTARFIIKY